MMVWMGRVNMKHVRPSPLRSRCTWCSHEDSIWVQVSAFVGIQLGRQVVHYKHLISQRLPYGFLGAKVRPHSSSVRSRGGCCCVLVPQRGEVQPRGCKHGVCHARHLPQASRLKPDGPLQLLGWLRAQNRNLAALGCATSSLALGGATCCGGEGLLDWGAGAAVAEVSLAAAGRTQPALHVGEAIVGFGDGGGARLGSAGPRWLVTAAGNRQHQHKPGQLSLVAAPAAIHPSGGSCGCVLCIALTRHHPGR